jgi:hypothetical protein
MYVAGLQRRRAVQVDNTRRRPTQYQHCSTEDRGGLTLLPYTAHLDFDP